jgi:hypothetical protein
MILRNGAILLGGAFILVGVALFAIAEAGNGGPAPVGDDSPQALLERIKKLEARMAQLERQPPAMIYPMQALPSPNFVSPGMQPQVPPNWIPREFNGQRFYIAPIEKSK